jgi:hypothetical protein
MTRLKRLYLAYNRLYFGSRLPADLPVTWCRSLPKELWACMEFDKKPRAIKINASLMGSGQWAKMKLLHEMAHVSVHGKERGEHGPLWHREMRRLARVGAFDDLW